MPTPLDDYLFDLNGYLVLRQAVSADLVRRLNASIDALLPLGPNQWRGRIYNESNTSGHNYMNVIEAGAPFEELIDHPAWLSHVNRYVGGDDGLFIDECFANVRGPGQATHLHSGGDTRRIRTQFRFHNNAFRCGQVNVLLYLTDVGPGDGATMVIPASHKSNLRHPQFQTPSEGGAKGLENIAAAIEVHVKAGDALLFVDCLAHGSAERIAPGQRRMTVYRYGPHWSNTRNGYSPSPDLLSRLTPARKQIIQPIPPLTPPAQPNPS